MGMPRHLALGALGEVLSSIPLITGSRMAINYFLAPCSLGDPLQETQGPQEEKTMC